MAVHKTRNHHKFKIIDTVRQIKKVPKGSEISAE